MTAIKLTAAQDRVVRLLAGNHCTYALIGHKSHAIYVKGIVHYDAIIGYIKRTTIDKLQSLGIWQEVKNTADEPNWPFYELRLTDTGRAYAKSKGWI